MASSIYWPQGLPDGEALPVPLRDGYSYAQRAPSLRTDFGLISRARRIYSDASADMDIGFAFSPDQSAYFEGFFWHGLDAGTAWFWLPVVVGGVLEQREVNFNGQPPKLSLMGVNYGMYTATLATRRGTQMSAENWLMVNALGGTESLRRFRNVLDYSVNTVIPQMGSEEQ